MQSRTDSQGCGARRSSSGRQRMVGRACRNRSAAAHRDARAASSGGRKRWRGTWVEQRQHGRRGCSCRAHRSSSPCASRIARPVPARIAKCSSDIGFMDATLLNNLPRRFRLPGPRGITSPDHSGSEPDVTSKPLSARRDGGSSKAHLDRIGVPTLAPRIYQTNEPSVQIPTPPPQPPANPVSARSLRRNLSLFSKVIAGRLPTRPAEQPKSALYRPTFSGPVDLGNLVGSLKLLSSDDFF